MARRDWWGGVVAVATTLLVLAGAVAFDAVVPRYEWLTVPPGGVSGRLVRIDRWTGEAQLFLARPSELNAAGLLEPIRR